MMASISGTSTSRQRRIAAGLVIAVSPGAILCAFERAPSPEFLVHSFYSHETDSGARGFGPRRSEAADDGWRRRPASDARGRVAVHRGGRPLAVAAAGVDLGRRHADAARLALHLRHAPARADGARHDRRAVRR